MKPAKEPESLVLGLAGLLFKLELVTVTTHFSGSLWSMVTVATGLDDSVEAASPPAPTLGSLSLLLVLSLSCHQHSSASNPFKEILAVFQNSQGLSDSTVSRLLASVLLISEVSTMPTTVTSFKLDYSALYERLCATVQQVRFWVTVFCKLSVFLKISSVREKSRLARCF